MISISNKFDNESLNGITEGKVKYVSQDSLNSLSSSSSNSSSSMVKFFKSGHLYKSKFNHLLENVKRTLHHHKNPENLVSPEININDNENTDAKTSQDLSQNMGETFQKTDQ
ncbi:unnamed protein product [Gordionus sp. m RMFG-2023]